ncbi:MAG: hypothetical protein KME19_00395 [Microcoleus vaginatus WJT46-NPBG5]|jgi:TolB protein|nr:hypothetical protein [Microcoleus vaginatus WJT46-NPBG5]
MNFSWKKIESDYFRKISGEKFSFSPHRLIPTFLLAGILSAGTSFMLFNVAVAAPDSMQSISEMTQGENTSPPNKEQTQKLSYSKIANKRQKTFTSSTFRASLQYPSHWKLIEGYDTFNTRYGSADGFFMMSASQSGGIAFEALCAEEANHKLKPYGSKPRIEKLKIQGQQACLIWPSPDQDKTMLNQAQLIVKAPRLIEISGSRYNNFVLVADKNHMRTLTKALKFI